MVRTKFGRNRPVSNAAGLTQEVRDKASMLVRREEYRTGSRMVAYEHVGSMIGVSGEWVRKFIRGYESGLSYVTGMNIVALYSRVCERIEASAMQLESENEAGESDAAMDQGVAVQTEAGPSHEAGLPPPDDDWT